MRLYLSIKKMNFGKDNIEHDIINGVLDEEFLGYDVMVELPDDDKFIKDTLRIIYKKDKEGKDTDEIEGRLFDIRERKTWNGFPLYQFKDGKIIPFNWKNYSYFSRTDRRMALASKINDLYNPSSEAKILRKTLKYILNELKLDCPEFLLYNEKVEEIIEKIPKEKK